MTVPPVAIPFFVSAAISAALAIYAWRHRLTPGSRSFAFFMFAVALYSVGYAMELASPDLQTALLWSKVQYAGILAFPTLFLVFVIQYTGRGHWLTPANTMLIFVLPVLLFIAKLFDENLHLLYASAQMEVINSFFLLTFTRGPLYVPMSIYHIAVVTIANVLLISNSRFTSFIFRMQMVILIAAATLIYAIYVLYLLDIPLHPILEGIDVNPLSYAIWAAGVSLAIYRYRLLDLVPIARDALIERLGDGVIVLDVQDRVVDINPQALRIFGWERSPIGHFAGDPNVLGAWIGQSTLDSLEGSTKKEFSFTKGDTTTHYEMAISALQEKGLHIGHVIVVHDISERKELELKLEELSIQDDLTGLHNRRGFNMLATQLIKMANRMQRNAALFYIDIDGLKWINDNFGHATGDQALKDMADTLKSSFRASDVVARLSGDEFVVLAIVSHENSAEMMLQRLEASTSQHAKLGRNFELAFSTGWAHYEWERPQPLESLQKVADEAMYKVKQAKKRSPGEN